MKLIYNKTLDFGDRTAYEFSFLFITGVIGNKRGWIRFFRKGFKYNHKSFALTFSERSGNRKIVKMFNYNIGLLK